MSSSAAASQGMLCPVCKVTLSISERQGVEIDFCPQCRGVWLDRGELDKIIERSETAAPPQPRAPEREYDERHRSGHHERKRRRDRKSGVVVKSGVVRGELGGSRSS